jgi:hypothetical protein
LLWQGASEAILGGVWRLGNFGPPFAFSRFPLNSGAWPDVDSPPGVNETTQSPPKLFEHRKELTMIVLRRQKVAERDPNEGRCKTVPSPARIDELCAKIRQTWSPRERRRRSGMTRSVQLMEMPLESRRKGFWE